MKAPDRALRQPSQFGVDQSPGEGQTLLAMRALLVQVALVEVRAFLGSQDRRDALLERLHLAAGNAGFGQSRLKG